MKLTLFEIVESLIINYKFSDKDLIATVDLLVNGGCENRKTLFKIGKIVNDAIEYEKQEIS